GNDQKPHTLPSLQYFSTLNDTNQDHHDRNDQEQVNESPQRVRGNHAKHPENDQDERYSPDHSLSFRRHAAPELRRREEARRRRWRSRRPKPESRARLRWRLARHRLS